MNPTDSAYHQTAAYQKHSRSPGLYDWKMDQFTGILGDLNLNNRFSWNGQLATTCEAELQELMKQIDIMFQNKYREWDRDTKTLEAKLEVRDKECTMQRVTIEQKHREIGQYRHQVESMERNQRETVAEYEHQLHNLRTEVGMMKTSYEKLQKKHAKHSRQMEEEKNHAKTELQDRLSDLDHLKQKIDEYRMKTKDWEMEKRSLQKHAETLESQRLALTNKCDIIQQQSHGYQSQLDKRRQLLDNTEYNLKSQITQLEGQLERAKDTMASQESQLEKMKVALDDSNRCQTQLHEERDQIDKELLNSKKTIMELEDEVARVNLELQKTNDLWKLTEEEQQRRLADIDRLEQIIQERDNNIRTMESKSQKDHSEALRKLHEENQNIKQELKNYKKTERKIFEDSEKLQTKNQQLIGEINDLRHQLEQKAEEMKILEETEMRNLTSEINKLRDNLQQKDENHSSELNGMRQELSNLTTELHQRNIQVATLSERATQIERQSRDENEKYEKRAAELGVVNAQLEALRLENQHLRKSALRHLNTNTDMKEAEAHLKELQNTYTANLQKLEEENENLHLELEELQRQFCILKEESEEREEEAMSETDRSIREIRQSDERRIQDLERHYEKRLSAMNDRHTATIKQYTDENQKLKLEKQTIEEDLKSKNNLIQRMTGEHSVMSTFVHDVSHIICSPTKQQSTSISDTSAPRSRLDLDPNTSVPRGRLDLDPDMSVPRGRVSSLDSTDYIPNVSYNRVFTNRDGDDVVAVTKQRYARKSSSPIHHRGSPSLVTTNRYNASPVATNANSSTEKSFGWKQRVRIAEPCSDKQSPPATAQKQSPPATVVQPEQTNHNANNSEKLSPRQKIIPEKLVVVLPPEEKASSSRRQQQTSSSRRHSPQQTSPTHLPQSEPSLVEADSPYSSEEEVERRSNSPESVATRFLQEEQERTKELEKIIDSHIEDLKIETEKTIKKYTS